jgi:hypothetical protein
MPLFLVFQVSFVHIHCLSHDLQPPHPPQKKKNTKQTLVSSTTEEEAPEQLEVTNIHQLSLRETRQCCQQ